MITRKTIYSISTAVFLLTSMTAQSMDKKPSKTKRMKNIMRTASNIILGRQIEQNNPIVYDLSLSGFPADIQRTIMNHLTTISETNSLTDVAKALRALTQVNKEFNALINNPIFFSTLMKRYAKIFKKTDSDICNIIKTQAAKTRLAIQASFENDICINPDADNSRFQTLVNSGFDPYFTNHNNDTPAEICIRNYNVNGLKMLLDFGVDPEFIGNNGISLYDLASSRPSFELKSPMVELLNEAIDNKNLFN